MPRTDDDDVRFVHVRFRTVIDLSFRDRSNGPPESDPARLHRPNDVSYPALLAMLPYAPLRPAGGPAGNSATGARRVRAGVFMISPDPSAAADQPSESRNRLVLVVYTAAIFVSALLLFSVQPLFTKMVLPRLGGSPAVWSVAMVFFQSLLLGGYAYAHYLMQLRNRAHSGGDASGAAGGRAADAAAVDCERVGRAADLRLCVLAARPVRGLDRAAVLRARRQQSAAAGLVRPHRPSQRSRSVLPLCLLEYRQLPGAAVLSGAAGADVHAAHAEPDLDRRLWPADRPDRKLRRAAAALAGEGGGAEHAGRRCRRAGAVMDLARALDISRRGAVGPADRGHRAYFHRRRRGAAAVGAAAVALSPDLGAGVPVAAAAAAQMDAAGAAAGDRRRRRAARGRRRAESAADARRPSALLLRHRDGLPWRTGAHPPGSEISHRLLCRAVVRRHGRRPVRRPDRAVHLFLDRGISDPAGAGGAVPSARQRAAAALEPLVLAVPRRARGGADRADLFAPASCSPGSTTTGSG